MSASQGDWGRTALVVVDVQNDFCSEGGAFDRAGVPHQAMGECVPRIARLVEAARGAGVPVFFYRNHYDERYVSAAFVEKMRARGVWPLCQEGTRGAELAPPLQPRPDEPILVKHRYSPFVGTDFEERLRRIGVETLLIAGVATNVCVESCARDAFMRDFRVIVVRECCATVNEALHVTSLANIQSLFGEVLSLEEVLRELGARSGRPAGRRERG